MPNNQIRSTVLGALLRLNPESADLRWTQTELLERQALDLVVQGKPIEAVDLFTQSLREKEKLIEESPEHHHWRLSLGKSYASPARLCETLENREEAVRLLRRGIEVLQSLESENGLDENTLDEIARTLQSFHAQMSNLVLLKVLDRHKKHES